MELVDQAFLAKRRGNASLANELTRLAFEQELAATELLKHAADIEPTRSVLLRSAASLALECGEIREAERLITTALSGEPPAEIAEELRNLLEQTYFSRHLRLQNIDLSSGELQLSISGSVVGYGIALSEVLVERIKDIERLIYRTVERKLGKVFREHGSTTKSISGGYSLYIAAPRPGSFAVTLRLGRQMQLPGFDLSSEVIDELVECLELLNEGDDERLKEKIPQETYYRNFIGLAGKIAPDGDKVKMVGLTRVKDDREVRIALTKTQDEISTTANRRAFPVSTEGEAVTVTGRLLFADATRTTGRIQLVEPSGQRHNVMVPEGMMDDIVRPLWDKVVKVSGVKLSRGGISLQGISEAE